MRSCDINRRLLNREGLRTSGNRRFELQQLQLYVNVIVVIVVRLDRRQSPTDLQQLQLYVNQA